MAYIIRLDDACEKMDIEKWDRMEGLLDKYGIKPLVGVIPHCEDPMMDRYEYNHFFWDKVHSWEGKGWAIALHGYNHVYSTKSGGINPVNKKSEFAGEPLEIQKEKIALGVEILHNLGINPKVFFAPAHTFDENTLLALKECSEIRIISDTVANDVYSKDGFSFVPLQAGSVRSLPLKTVTFCYHPNVMSEKDFEKLEKFLLKNGRMFIPFPTALVKRNYSYLDIALNRCYFCIRKIRSRSFHFLHKSYFEANII